MFIFFLSEVSAQKTTTSSTRDEIKNELMKNVKLIAAIFIGDVDRCIDFFEQSFIRGSSIEEEETPAGPSTLPTQ